MLKTQELSQKSVEQNSGEVMYDRCGHDENDNKNNKNKENVENSIVENTESKAIPSIKFDYKQLIVPNSDEGIVYQTSNDKTAYLEKDEHEDRSNELFYRNVTIAGWVAFAVTILAFFIITLQ